jgi:MYXO-CTERM domain-containing protein
MRVVALAIPLLLVLALLVGPLPSQAQQPSASAATLWAHGSADADGVESLWSNFNQNDPDATDTANGPGYNCGVPVPVLGQAVCDEAGDPGVADPPEEDIDETFTLAMKPALSVAMRFAPGQDADVVLYFGATTGKGSGSATVQLKAGDVVVAESAAIPFTFDQGYAPAAGKATMKVPSVDSGTALTWTIHATGKATGFFLGVHKDTGQTRMGLPLVGEAPTALVGFPVKVNFTAASPTEGKHTYSWAAPAGQIRLQVQGNASGGEALVLVRNGNTTLANTTFKGTAFTKDLAGPGNWTLEIRLAAFKGDVTVSFSPTGAPGSAVGSGTKAPAGGGSGSGTKSKSGTSSTTCTSTNSTSNATANATACGGGKKKDSPGPSLPVLAIALVAAAAIVLRRRRW